MLSTVACGVGTQTTSLPGWATLGSVEGFCVSGVAWAGAVGAGAVWAGAAWANALAAASVSATATRPRVTGFTSIISASLLPSIGISRVHHLAAVDVDGLAGDVGGGREARKTHAAATSSGVCHGASGVTRRIFSAAHAS